MRKWVYSIGLLCSVGIALAACGGQGESATTPPPSSQAAEAGDEANTAVQSKTITYLGTEYNLNKTDNIIIASLEAMEDAAVLGVKPAGTVTEGGAVPEYMASYMEGAADVGNRMQPNAESILELQADVILGSSKFQPAVAEQLEKVAPMIPVSHISSNWEANLNMLAEITGKQAEAAKILEKYKSDAAAVKEKMSEIWKDQKVLMVRIRTGNIYVYPADVYFNPSLYADLGAPIPEELKEVKAQEAVSLEKLAEMNPDVLFVQFAESENKDQPQALKDLQSNPIWNSINAVKNNKLYINLVDPNAQGGTSWSKIAFLDAVMNKIASAQNG